VLRKKATVIYQIKQSDLPKKLWYLIDAALRGEPVFIERDDKSLVQIIPLKQMLHPRKAGSAKGKVEISDDFDTPLGDFADYMP
jgi:antitoxin (DNA-binding transcriptional repressor) of toxin-antitoxin stability system